MCCMADKWAHVTTCMCRRCCWCDYCVCRTWTVWRYSVVTGASDTTLKVFVWLLWADDWSQWKTLLCVNSSSLACLWVCWCRVCHSAVSVPCQWLTSWGNWVNCLNLSVIQLAYYEQHDRHEHPLPKHIHESVSCLSFFIILIVFLYFWSSVSIILSDVCEWSKVVTDQCFFDYTSSVAWRISDLDVCYSRRATLPIGLAVFALLTARFG